MFIAGIIVGIVIGVMIGNKYEITVNKKGQP